MIALAAMTMMLGSCSDSNSEFSQDYLADTPIKLNVSVDEPTTRAGYSDADKPTGFALFVKHGGQTDKYNYEVWAEGEDKNWKTYDLAFMSRDTAKITSTDVLTKNSTAIGNYRDSVFQLSQTGKYATMSDRSLSSTWNPSTTATTNFVDSSRNKIAQSSIRNGILVTTGTSEKNKVMNIYDVAGNVFEWTLEYTSSTNDPCAFRGGGFSITGSGLPAASRYSSSTDLSDSNIGFRVSLF